MEKEFITSVLTLVRSTRSLSLPHWGTAEIHSQKNSDPGSVVTAVDLAIEKHLTQQLAVLDPSIEFVGEEFGGNRDADRFWLCDPIDGTADYIRGLPFCTTMLALVEQGHVTFSVIYDFTTDTMYHAVRGGGAYKEAEPIRVSNRALKDAYLFYESNLDIDDNLATYLSLKRSVPLLKTMSAGYEFAMVASGRMDGRVCKDPYGKDYDFAPGTLLVAEAGGKVTNIGTDSYDYKNLNFIASTTSVHQELTDGADALFPLKQ